MLTAPPPCHESMGRTHAWRREWKAGYKQLIRNDYRLLGSYRQSYRQWVRLEGQLG